MNSAVGPIEALLLTDEPVAFNEFQQGAEARTLFLVDRLAPGRELSLPCRHGR